MYLYVTPGPWNPSRVFGVLGIDAQHGRPNYQWIALPESRLPKARSQSWLAEAQALALAASLADIFGVAKRRKLEWQMEFKIQATLGVRALAYFPSWHLEASGRGLARVIESKFEFSAAETQKELPITGILPACE
jgi:hypothetical protein